ncbi:unnamed protein product [Durusdinium trenchii]|uniref:Ribosome biogenesis protein NOP53 n=1 Tax=Durusdinium trenchii TaxID=1381693 RepID=A0ABP0SG90_9DINO
MPKKRRRASKASADGLPQEGQSPAFRRKGWKSVELDLDMMKEFEAQGGLFLEEADPDEIGVEYLAEPKLPAAKKRKKTKKNVESEDLSKENERLRKELDELRNKTEVQEEELASTELSAWAQFELHPKLMVGSQDFRFAGQALVSTCQATCLG